MGFRDQYTSMEVVVHVCVIMEVGVCVNWCGQW